ncbi:MAG: SRPBCC family protein [Rhodothermia bacterium]|nr:SRPBCC family protein [Rhodothermia bacterium]
MNAPVVRTQMLIRRPVQDVFEAIVDPTITTNFWFTKSTGRMEPGATLHWEWEMYGAVARVIVKEVERSRRILMEWKEPPCPVEWVFEARGNDATLVRISNWGFSGSDDEMVAAAIDSMGGFTSLLAGLKAYLEHGIQLNLVADHHPDAHVDSAT